MSVEVKRRRGSSSEIAIATPALGEIIVNTDDYSLVVGDGSTIGGVPQKTIDNSLSAAAKSNAHATNGAWVRLTDRGNKLFKYTTGYTATEFGVLSAQNGLVLVIEDIINGESRFNAVGWGAVNGQESSAATNSIINYIESNAAYDQDSTKDGYSAEIYFKAGRYEVTGLSITKFGIKLVGDGEGSILYNTQTTGRMLTVEWDSGSSTIGSCPIENMQLRNTVTRDIDAGELLFFNSLVRSQLNNVRFISSPFTAGAKTPTRCDFVKMRAPFEVSMLDCFFWGSIGIALDIISGPQSDSVDLRNTVFLNNTVACTGYRGAGGSGGNNIKFSGKMLGYQGGSYVSDGEDAFAVTTVSSIAGLVLNVADATNMKVGMAVVVGTNADGSISNDMGIAIITAINTNAITLDRTITSTASAKVISGRFGFIGSECRQPAFNNIQLEGLDVGILATTGTRYISASNFSISSVAKPFYMSCQFRNLELSCFGASAVGTLQSGVTWKLITVDDNITSDSNAIFIAGDGTEGSPYTDGTYSSLIDITGAYDPFLTIRPRREGVVYAGDNQGSAVEFLDRSYQVFNRSSASTFCRTIYQENGTDKWYINFADVDGDLQVKLAGGADSIKISGVNGNVLFGGTWDGPHIVIGAIHMWQDSVSDDLRGKIGAPAANNEGVVIQAF